MFINIFVDEIYLFCLKINQNYIEQMLYFVRYIKKKIKKIKKNFFLFFKLQYMLMLSLYLIDKPLYFY